jgi:hypothetical protein
VWRYAVLSVVLAVVACEAVLSLLAFVSPYIAYQLSPPWNRNVLPDPVLGWRMSPFHPGHDRRGYRNNGDVAATYDVLAIGDSMTYGLFVLPEDTWPYQLAALARVSVYNTGVGGYGPCEYAAVLDENLELHPKMVVVGLFLGNDFADAFQSVYVDRRCSQWASSDPAVRRDIEQADAGDVLRILEKMRTLPEADRAEPLYKRTALYGLGRSLLYQLHLRKLHNWSEDPYEVALTRPGRMGFDAVPQFRTVFPNPEAHGMVMNLDDPRIREGWRITQAALRTMKATLNARGARFMVLLLHDKTYVMSDLVRERQPDVPAGFLSVVAVEARLTETVEGWLLDHDIGYVDTAKGMRALLSRGVMPYPESDDFHPRSTGYLAIAQALLPAGVARLQ